MKRFNVRQWIVVVGILACLVGFGLNTQVYVLAEGLAQALVSATPARITLPNAGNAGESGGGVEQAPVQQEVIGTPTPTRTPTPQGPVRLEAITEANVRAEADPDAELLGSIRAGDSYNVLGRYFRWYQFQFDTSPTGTGWVFDELVTIIGDETLILDLTVSQLPTEDPISLAATQTMEILTQIPGGVLTATANARILVAPGEGAVDTGGLPSVGEITPSPEILPTFTPPVTVSPEVEDSPLAAPQTSEELSLNLPNSLPPIVPIGILGGLGLLGLMVGRLRR